MATWFDPCRLASTPTDGSIAVSPSTFSGSIDGKTVNAGDKVLLTQQSTASQNGTYVLTAGKLVLQDTNAVGASVRVTDGNTLAQTEWSLNDLTKYIWARKFTKVNIRNFNALGDGSTDDSTAITSCTCRLHMLLCPMRSFGKQCHIFHSS
jgi:hypothetical protein